MPELRSVIDGILAQRGALSVAEYMALCLGHPQYGYYMTRDPFGAQGDFTTAPEISQLFGEMVGVWVASVWERAGKPDNVRLVEMGPGRGTLMSDLLRAVKSVAGFLDSTSIHMVEFSPALQKIQSEKLHGYNVTWHDHIDDVPPGFTIIIANEFFDALPIDQAVFHNGHWHKRMIAAAEEDLILTLGAPLQGIHVPNATDGAVYEYAPLAAEMMTTLSRRIADRGGAMLIVDYGDDAPLDNRVGDTLQALYKHAPAPVLENPGHADVTAHVAFAALRAIALENACTPAPVITQREFLLDHGVQVRAEHLMRTATDTQRADILSGLGRLVDADKMGHLFKVLEVYG
jgi:NADH dehydrogenase [ubiquinone] 1 alpha subcomplex assembly factor 7